MVGLLAKKNDIKIEDLPLQKQVRKYFAHCDHQFTDEQHIQIPTRYMKPLPVPGKK